MIRYEDLPDDNAVLANIEVAFPRLSPDSPKECPVPMNKILEYLRCESPGGESLQANDLQFLRTALVAEDRYWIWRFTESDNSECFVTVSVAPNGTSCIGYDINWYSLTPELFTPGTYYNVF